MSKRPGLLRSLACALLGHVPPVLGVPIADENGEVNGTLRWCSRCGVLIDAPGWGAPTG